MDFTKAISHVLTHEGGLVDHPLDPGGITKYGISLRAYPTLGEDGIRALTKKEAIALYKRDYWDTGRCTELPKHLRLMMLDCAVNQGPRYAVKALQASVSVHADGVLGPVTLAAANKAPAYYTLHRFANNRFLRYLRNPNWDTYGEGWTSRLLSTTLQTTY